MMMMMMMMMIIIIIIFRYLMAAKRIKTGVALTNDRVFNNIRHVSFSFGAHYDKRRRFLISMRAKLNI